MYRKSVVVIVFCVLCVPAMAAQMQIRDDYDLTIEVAQHAMKGWRLYRQGKFVGSYNGGHYTDPILDTAIKEFWSDGVYAKFDRDSNGHQETMFIVCDGAIKYFGCIGSKGVFTHTALAYRSFVGKSFVSFIRAVPVLSSSQAGAVGNHMATGNVGVQKGSLLMRVTRFAKPVKVHAYVFKAGTKSLVSRYAVDEKPNGVELAEGKYDVIVVDRDVAGGESQILRGLKVPGGRALKKRVVFEAGRLRVYAFDNSRPVNAMVTVKRAGRDVCRLRSDKFPRRGLVLPVGIYDIVLTGGNRAQTAVMRNVVVKNGSTLGKRLDLTISPKVMIDTPVAEIPRNVREKQRCFLGAYSDRDIDAMAQTLGRDGDKIHDRARDYGMAQLDKARSMIKASKIIPDRNRNVTKADEVELSAGPAGTTGPTGIPAGVKVGADFSGVVVGAREPELAADWDEHQDDGVNPYAGMSKEQAQKAFAAQVGLQGPNSALLKTSDFRLGEDYPLYAKIAIKKMQRYSEKLGGDIARKGNPNDIAQRLETAKKNLLYLHKRLRDDASRDTLQRLIYTRVNELNSIRMSIDMLK